MKRFKGKHKMANLTKEQENNSLGAMMYQGKSLVQWAKDLDNRFTIEELVNLIKGGVDLGRILYGLIDETDKDIDDKSLFKDEEFFFEQEDESALDEDATEPEDVVTVGDFIELLRRNSKLDDKLVFRSNKKEMILFDVNSKGGTTLVDIIDRKSGMLESVELDLESNINGDYLTISDLEKMGKKAWPHNSTAWKIDNIAGIVNGKVVDFMNVKYIRPDYPSNGTFYLLDGKPESLEAFNAEKDIILNEKEKMTEGRSWYGGGYGGTGRSYRSLGDKAPRGAEIGWYAVEQIDPKAKGKMPGWRMGPSNFAGFTDLLYPERKYKMGTTVMRNKYVKAGSESGTIYIAIPSYFDSIKNNDEAAIKLLKDLGIPLDLTFGLDPNDDYSMTYTIKS